jgi:outer membrane protein assembly factor BamD (BamD/ComL family)
MYRYLICLCLFLLGSLPCQARSVRQELRSQLGTSYACYKSAMYEIERKNYAEARTYLLQLEREFPHAKELENCYFWLGVIEFEGGNLEHADEYFGKYLRSSVDQHYFQKALEYRYFIAEKFAYGEKARPFKMRLFPKMLSGQEIALEILEDITKTVQAHDLSARSYYLKGYLYWKNLHYKEAIANYQSLVKKFPKHELAPNAHLGLLYVWKCIAVREPQNPDILELAALSFEEYRENFPNSPGLAEGEEILQGIREVLARALVRTGKYYRRKGKIRAARVYYERAVTLYPTTKWADHASCLLETLPNCR